MVRITDLNISMAFQLLINTYYLEKGSLVVNVKPIFSRERESRILGIEYGFMLLYKNPHTVTRNIRER
jgi:hypothetical protein